MVTLHADYVQIVEETGFHLWDVYLWHLNIPPGGNRTILGSFPYPHKVRAKFAHSYILIFRKL